MPQNRPIDLQDLLHSVSARSEAQPSETSRPEVASIGQPEATLHLSNPQFLRPPGDQHTNSPQDRTRVR